MADQKNQIETYTVDYVKADTESSVFLGNPHIDNLFSAFQNMAAHLWAVKSRMHVIEALLERKVPVTNAAIEQYMPTAEERDRWKAERDDMINFTYAPFLRVGGKGFASAQAQAYDPRRDLSTVPANPPVLR